MKDSRAKRVLLIAAVVLVVVVFSIHQILSYLARPIEVTEAMKKPPASMERWREEARQRQPSRPLDDPTQGSASPEAERAAQLYVELEKEIQDFNQNNRIFDVFFSSNWRIGRDEPTTAILAFLRENPRYISKLEEFARNGIMPTHDLVLNAEHDRAKPVPDYTFFYYSARVLCANAYLLLEDGNTTDSLDSALDCIAIGKIKECDQDLISKLVSIVPQSSGVMTLADLVGRMHLGPDATNNLLDRLDAANLAPKDYPSWFIPEYASSREMLIMIATVPLDDLLTNRQFHFWDRNDPPNRFDLLGIEIPNPKIINVMGAPLVNPLNPVTLRTIRFRNKFGEVLAGYDKWVEELLVELRKPCSEFRQEIWRENLAYDWQLPLYLPNFQEAYIRGLVAETRYNLLRAGLEYGIDPASAQAAQNADFIANRKHRWRDPFTEKPLHVNDSDDGPVFYSLGPDLKDQKGKITYDPTNGTVSPGDVTLRIAHHPETSSSARL